MPEQFDITFNQITGEKFSYSLELGKILFILGANGTGKSSLISQIFKTHHQHAKRISAHRQTWFTSNTLDMTPRSRDDLENNIKSRDQQIYARYREDYAAERAGVAIYDLIDSDTMLAREITDLVRDGKVEEACEKAKTPSPIQVINELMRLSNMPVEISLEERQRIMASRSGSAPYSIAELSDGERGAFLIAAAVLTADPKTLVLIDEPERHLHRSIISPLLTLLFEKRKDCAFIVSTHEVMLPVDNSSASTLLIRSCEYADSQAKSWRSDILAPNTMIDDELKQDILGARKRIIFVEGTAESLDAPLYSLLFPQVSIIPKESCRDVERSVKSLREAEDLHWIRAWGIVDSDRREIDDIERLKMHNVYALSHYSVEALYYHPEIIKKVASRQAKVTGDDPEELYDNAVMDAIESIKNSKAHLIEKAVERLVRKNIFESLPSKEDVQSKCEIEIKIDIAASRTAEKMEIDKLITENKFEKLLQRYPIRESGSLDRIARGIGLKKSKYEEAVRKLLQEDETAIKILRDLFTELLSEINAS